MSVAKIIEMSGTSPKMSGKSANCVTMIVCVTNLPFSPKKNECNKTIPQMWQLAGSPMGPLQ